MRSERASATRTARQLARVRAWLNGWRLGQVLLGLATLSVAMLAIRTVLERNHGQPGVPLDDAYIHFQFARAFSQLSPFEYTEGAKSAAGATSLLWPALLVPYFWLGLDGINIIWLAWCLGFLALYLLALETASSARTLLAPGLALLCAVMVLCFGGLVWLAGSGMEAVGFAWLWLRSARRVADYLATRDQPVSASLSRELVVLSYVTPLMRPEGSLVALAVAAAFLMRQRRQPAWCLTALCGVLVRPLFYWLGAGDPQSTTSLVKWLPNNPYLSHQEVLSQILSNLKLLYFTLLNGEVWSASVLPEGSAIIAWCAVPALALLAYIRGKGWHGAALIVAALGMWIPCTFDTFLWNRLRYLWPFAPAWFIGAGALCEFAGLGLARLQAHLRAVNALGAASIAVALVLKLPGALSDLAESSWAISEQQVSLGRWVHQNLPSEARVGVNDTGAIAYFSKRQTFDIVGLTTPGEGRYWVAGAGSRFEHYERLGQHQLPSHFAVYPEWFGLDPLLGRQLTERFVNASILGGTSMVLHEADYSSLRSAEHPLFEVDAKISDRLDVADLESEAGHAYELLDASQSANGIQRLGHRVDGERRLRTLERFRLDLAAAHKLSARLSAADNCELEVSADGVLLGKFSLAADSWQEPSLNLPVRARKQGVQLEIRSVEGCTFGAMHYWALALR